MQRPGPFGVGEEMSGRTAHFRPIAAQDPSLGGQAAQDERGEYVRSRAKRSALSETRECEQAIPPARHQGGYQRASIGHVGRGRKRIAQHPWLSCGSSTQPPDAPSPRIPFSM